MPSVDSRLATLEAEHKNYNETQKAIFEYMRKGSAQRDEMIQGFATLCEQSKATLKYQQDCDIDRKVIGKRVAILETASTKQGGVILGVSLVMGAIGTIVGCLVEWYRRG